MMSHETIVTTTPSTHVVIMNLVGYAQEQYDGKRITWDSYAKHVEQLYESLCESVGSLDPVTDSDDKEADDA